MIILVAIPFLFAPKGYEDKDGFHWEETQNNNHLKAL
jgi:hypothetical protein